MTWISYPPMLSACIPVYEHFGFIPSRNVIEAVAKVLPPDRIKGLMIDLSGVATTGEMMVVSFRRKP